jgi:hypothetical protein
MTVPAQTTNSLIRDFGEWIDGTQSLRHQLLELITPADLAFAPHGNPTLGELCAELVAVETEYAVSFRTLKMDYGRMYSTIPPIATDLNALKAAFAKSEKELKDAVSAWTEEQVATAMIDRGFPATGKMNVDVYIQALLIFYGKVSVYLKVMHKPIPKQWSEWIG